MRTIQLTKGKVAIVCDCHYDLVKNHKWCYSPSGYAVRRVGGRKASLTYMHIVIGNGQRGQEVDHINLNKLDNRCSNLRCGVKKWNIVNRAISRNNTSGYKGVSWIARRNSWQSRLADNGRIMFNRYFKTAEEAAIAYDCAAIQVHGNYARLNFLGEN